MLEKCITQPLTVYWKLIFKCNVVQKHSVILDNGEFFCNFSKDGGHNFYANISFFYSNFT